MSQTRAESNPNNNENVRSPWLNGNVLAKIGAGAVVAVLTAGGGAGAAAWAINEGRSAPSVEAADDTAKKGIGTRTLRLPTQAIGERPAAKLVEPTVSPSSVPPVVVIPRRSDEKPAVVRHPKPVTAKTPKPPQEEPAYVTFDDRDSPPWDVFAFSEPHLGDQYHRGSYRDGDRFKGVCQTNGDSVAPVGNENPGSPSTTWFKFIAGGGEIQ